MYNIKRLVDSVETTVATVRPNNGALSKKIMGENIVDLSFDAFAPIDFEIGDYINVFSNNYVINELPQYTKGIKENTVIYNYQIQFQGSGYELAKIVYAMLDSDNNLAEPDFFLMGTAEAFIDLVIANANRVQSGWTKGNIDTTDTRNLSFSSENCLGILAKLATEFENEWWIEGKTIHFTKVGNSSGLTFKYGKGNGLYNISRSNKEDTSIVTRLYAFGSTKNIPANYRNYSNRLKIPASAGLFLEQGVSECGVIEGFQVFEDVYPKRIGTVSAIDGASVFKFSDAGIDFDVNAQLIAGTEAKVQFTTGFMAGYEFSLSSYNSATKTFIINKNDNEKAIEIPGPIFKPSVGDNYIIYDIMMPASYITAAEIEIKDRGLAYLAKNAISRVNYTVNCDPLHFKRENISINLGDTVLIQDEALGINATIRVIGYTRSILLDDIEQYRYTLELSESVQTASIVRQVIKDEKVQQAIKLNDLLNPARVRANWRTSQEILSMVFDTDGYYDGTKIKPLSIETTMLQVGARSQQFTLTNVVFQPNYQAIANNFISSTGVLDHFTIDENIKTWVIAASNYTGLGNSAYYIYAKCEKAGTNGSILLSTSQITVNQDTDYYHFLIGVLHTAIGGVRGISLTYGQSTVNGKFITTGKIQSSDGLTYFDLDNNEIAGAIKFLPSGGGSLKSVASVDTLAATAKTTADTANTNAGNAQSSANTAQTVANSAQSTASTALNDAATAAGIANGKGKVLTQSTAPSAADQNSVTLWIDATGGANTPKRWSGSAWVAVTDKVAVDAANTAVNATNLANTAQTVANTAQNNATIAKNAADAAQATANEAKGITDNFTLIDGGVISSNTIKLGSLAQDVAGITGVGTSSSSIRFWAGESFANRNAAPFRVDQSGKVWMSNAVISGEVNATSGTIGGFVIGASGFGLNGTGVEIYPNQGVKVKGWLTIPNALSTDSETAGRWQVYVDESGTSGSGSGGGTVVGALNDLSDVHVNTPLNNQLLKYDSLTGKWINWTPNFTVDLGGYYTKSESDARYKAIGYQPAWGEVAGKPTVLSAFTNDLGNYGGFALANGSNVSGTWGINVSGKADGAIKLWSVSHPTAYYISNTWDGTYWQLTSNHGSAVNVGHATDSTTWIGYNHTMGHMVNSSSFDYMLTATGATISKNEVSSIKNWMGLGIGTQYHQQNPTFGIDANTVVANTSSFTYSINAPHLGFLGHWGNGGYGLQLNGSYIEANKLSFRNRNGDNSSWQPWSNILVDGYDYTRAALNGGLVVSGGTGTAYNASDLEIRAVGRRPVIGLHWAGTVASTISVESSGRIAIMNNPGTGYESLISSNFTSTGYVSALGTVSGSMVYAGFNPGLEGAIGASNWFYSSGDTGWFNATYGGGIRMTDYEWVRVYNGRGFLVENSVKGVDFYATGGIGYAVENYGLGLVGLYNSAKYQNVFSMGVSYKPAIDGTSLLNMFGIAWTHENAGTIQAGSGQSIAGLSHQALFVIGGQTASAIGNGIWTRGEVKANGFIVNQANGEGIGVALYQQTGPYPDYGLMFARTSNFGTHGGVAGDWATYFTMQGTTNRGWVFKMANTNVASIDGTGSATFDRVNTNNGFFSNDHGAGLCGVYSATRYQEVFSMGATYRPNLNGTSLADHYGIAWTHTNVGGQSKAGLGHQMIVTANGITQTAIGNGIWTRANIYAAGKITAVTAIEIPEKTSGTANGNVWELYVEA